MAGTGWGQRNAISTQDVLNAVQKSFSLATESLGQTQKIQISEASVTFSIATSRESGGTVKILIFKFGRKRTKEKESTVTFNLERDPNKSEDLTRQTDELANAIIAATKEFYLLTPNNDLKATSFEIELSFAITNSTEAGVEFTIFSSDAGAGKSWEKKASHKLRLKFTRPAGTKNSVTSNAS